MPSLTRYLLAGGVVLVFVVAILLVSMPPEERELTISSFNVKVSQRHAGVIEVFVNDYGVTGKTVYCRGTVSWMGPEGKVWTGTAWENPSLGVTGAFGSETAVILYVANPPAADVELFVGYAPGIGLYEDYVKNIMLGNWDGAFTKSYNFSLFVTVA